MKFFTSIFFLAIWFLPVHAQRDNYVEKEPEAHKGNKRPTTKGDFADRLSFGGNFGAFFGNSTYIQLSPAVGYKINEGTKAGVGFNYIYFSERFYNQRFSTSIYGPYFFAQRQIYSGLFAIGELHFLNMEIPNATMTDLERQWILSAPIGLGYYSSGRLGGVYIALMYDVINDPYSPFTNGSPVMIRFGFLL